MTNGFHAEKQITNNNEQKKEVPRDQVKDEPKK